MMSSKHHSPRKNDFILYKTSLWEYSIQLLPPQLPACVPLFTVFSAMLCVTDIMIQPYFRTHE